MKEFSVWSNFARVCSRFAWVQIYRVHMIYRVHIYRVHMGTARDQAPGFWNLQQEKVVFLGSSAKKQISPLLPPWKNF